MLNQITLAVEPDNKTLALAQEWLMQNCNFNKLSKRLRFILKLCLDEALTNVLDHGFKETTTSNPLVTLILEQVPEFIVLTIQDNGNPFNPTTWQSPSLPESIQDAPIGGHGLRIIRNYAHNLHYYLFNDYNSLQITIALE